MRLLPVILVLGLLGAGLTITRCATSADEPPPPDAFEPALAADLDPTAPPADPAADPAEDPVEPAAEAQAEAEPAPGDRTAVTADPPAEGPRVRVVRGDPPTAAAGVDVFFVTQAGAEARFAKLPTTPPRLEWPELFGQRSRTDLDGIASLPPTREPWLVAAVAGEQFAFAAVPPGNRTVTMPLLADEQVTVQVVRADGTVGAGIPVAVLQHRGEGEAEPIWEAATDARGEAVLRHFQLVRQAAPGPPATERFAAVLRMPLPLPAVAEFAGRPAPRDPVRLPLPAFGSLEVQLTDHRDTPLLSPAGLAVWPERPRDTRLPFPIAPGIERPRADKPVGAEPVLFAFVGVGGTMRIGARFEGDRRGVLSGPVAGPRRDGEVVRTSLPLSPELALLAGRLVTATGEPFGPALVPTAFWRVDRAVGQAVVHTIADGRFDLVQRPPADAAEYWLELRTTVAEIEKYAAPPRLRELGARVHFQALRPGERRELGQIVLAELPPLASGLVVDDRNEPVADAEVRLQQLQPPPPNPERGQAMNGDPWRDVPLAAARTGPDGTFTLFGERPPGQLRLRADTDQHFADSVPLHTVGQQVRIRIARNGVLRGRVLLPDWVADGTVTLQLRPFDTTLRERDTRSVALRRGRGGRFNLEPLRPGRYDAVVLVRNLQEPLAVLNDVFVEPGETRDGRLRPLDLRQALFRYRLRALDASGQLLPLNGPVLARLRKQDGGIAEAGFRWQRGTAELVTGSAMGEFVLFGPGCEPTVVTLGPGEHDVYMRQLQPALLYLPGARALCGPLRRVRVSTILADDTGYPQSLSGVDQRSGEAFSFNRWELGKSSGAWLLASDTVEVPLQRGGRYEVILRLHATDSERSPQASVSLGTFDLRVDGASMMPVTVPVDAAKVQEAIASLQQRMNAAPRQGRAR